MKKTSVDFFHRLASILSLSFFGASGLVQCLSGTAFRVPTGELARRRHPSKRARVDAEGRGGKAKSANERNCRRRRSQPPLTLALPLGLSLSFLFHFLSLSLLFSQLLSKKRSFRAFFSSFSHHGEVRPGPYQRVQELQGSRQVRRKEKGKKQLLLASLSD